MKSNPANFIPLQTLVTASVLAIGLLAAAAPATAGIVYVSNWSLNNVEKYDLATGTDLGVFATTGLNQPTGLALDRAGNLYVANRGNHTIQKFSPDGVGSFFASVNAPQGGMAFDNAGNLYVTDWADNNIMRFTPDGVGSVFATTGLNYATGLAFDSTGNLYAANFFVNTIEKFTPAGVGSLFAMTYLNFQEGLAFDSADNLYVAAGSTIKKFTPKGVGSVFPSTGLRGAVGLAFDGADNLYAVNGSDYTIEKFTPNGVGSVFAGRGIGMVSPQYIAIQVPEPSAWALLCIWLPALLAFRCQRAIPGSGSRLRGR